MVKYNDAGVLTTGLNDVRVTATGLYLTVQKADKYESTVDTAASVESMVSKLKKKDLSADVVCRYQFVLSLSLKKFRCYSCKIMTNPETKLLKCTYLKVVMMQLNSLLVFLVVVPS